MTQIEQMVEIFGGVQALGTSPGSQRDLVHIIRAGLPVKAFKIVLKRVNLTEEQAATHLGFSLRTIARRKANKVKLKKTESEKVMRLARVVALGLDVFGDETKLRTWLFRKSRGLGGVLPIELLDTDIGTTQVEDELRRIEYGVFS